MIKRFFNEKSKSVTMLRVRARVYGVKVSVVQKKKTKNPALFLYI